MHDVVIIGAGIVGCSTAYYLRQIGGGALSITIVDKVGLAAAASGRAGGFLARDCRAAPEGAEAPLARHSFALHAELARQFGAASLGYRPCRAFEPSCPGGPTTKTGSAWYDGCADNAPEIASCDEAAQVIPTRLCEALLAASGATLVVGAPTSLRAPSSKDTPYYMTVESLDTVAEYACDALLLACGPWTSATAAQLDVSMKAMVTGLKAHSVLIQPTGVVGADCLFIDWQAWRAWRGPKDNPLAGELELYSRADGMYVCGCAEPPRRVTESPADVTVSHEATACLLSAAASVSSHLEGATVLREAACYLPVTDTGAIVAGMLQASVYVATGHTCWGVLNGPATGQGIAQMMLGVDGEAARLLAPFAPECTERKGGERSALSKTNVQL